MANNQNPAPQAETTKTTETDFVQLTDDDALKEFDWDKVKPNESNNEIDIEDEEQEIAPELIEEDEIEEETDEEKAEREEREANETEEEKAEREAKEAELKAKKKPDTKPTNKKPTETKEEKAERLEQEKQAKVKGEEKEAYSILAEELVEDGVIQFAKVPKKDKLTKTELADVIEEEVTGRVNKDLKEMFEGLDEKAITFLKFLKDGGKTEDFVDTFIDSVIPDNLDLTKEKAQKEFLSWYLEEYENIKDEEDIKDRIEWLKEKGKLESTATKGYTKALEDQEARKEDLIRKTAAKNKKEQDQRVQFATDLTNLLATKKEIKGIKITDKDTKTLGEYITKAVHKQGNLKISKMQKAISDVYKDPEKIILLAKVLENDFNFDFAKVAGRTEATRTVKRSLEQAATGGKAPRNQGVPKRSLADFFPDS